MYLSLTWQFVFYICTFHLYDLTDVVTETLHIKPHHIQLLLKNIPAFLYGLTCDLLLLQSYFLFTFLWQLHLINSSTCFLNVISQWHFTFDTASSLTSLWCLFSDERKASLLEIWGSLTTTSASLCSSASDKSDPTALNLLPSSLRRNSPFVTLRDDS